ncbi:hypothetical protein [Hymenobacter sp. BT559]|uniref:hypothetical protein n=1 Tax=Hymenobacter sp. BT559 TaxID=2795729 RepID=UPI0018EE3ABD|nr:hypothetical protein [Hymenobacter sp. BT559]MBJ6141855.1 hypothetical protein [Hymenobacter sp. BT559]
MLLPTLRYDLLLSNQHSPLGYNSSCINRYLTYSTRWFMFDAVMNTTTFDTNRLHDQVRN